MGHMLISDPRGDGPVRLRAYTASAVSYMTFCGWLWKWRDSCFRISRDSNLGHSFYHTFAK